MCAAVITLSYCTICHVALSLIILVSKKCSKIWSNLLNRWFSYWILFQSCRLSKRLSTRHNFCRWLPEQLLYWAMLRTSLPWRDGNASNRILHLLISQFVASQIQWLQICLGMNYSNTLRKLAKWTRFPGRLCLVLMSCLNVVTITRLLQPAVDSMNAVDEGLFLAHEIKRAPTSTGGLSHPTHPQPASAPGTWKIAPDSGILSNSCWYSSFVAGQFLQHYFKMVWTYQWPLGTGNRQLNISIFSWDGKYLRFIWKNQRYEISCILFDYSLAPRVFTKVFKPIISHLRLHGLKIACSECLDQLQFWRQFITDLRIIVNDKKSQLEPSTKLTFLNCFHYWQSGHETLFTVGQIK